MKIHVKVWNVPLKAGSIIKVATIEQGERKPSSLCEGCYAKCCRGKIYPVLDSDEFLNRKFPFLYMETPNWIKTQVPRADYLVTLAVSEEGCPNFDKEKLKCKLWPNPPKSCLAYDCREDERPFMRKFAKIREREWKRNRRG